MADTDRHFLPKDVREGLLVAQKRARRTSGGKLRVHVGDTWYPIRSYDETGFDVGLDVAPKLRGLVEIHEGSRILRTVLIVAAEPSGDVMHYDFKRATAARDTPPLDYPSDTTEPVGYLPAGSAT
ncbi:hypothetical protein JANAI62_14350 [Jannaschia pagri]|uniref:Uncharacterized protein n=1 Tax=Jannaschia pagri TaxID=2829797 RepID=A0ABQ4NL30_9RHOB|nr:MULTISPECIES: hypothetical protein [unclassified Jannaschia]GIT90980.1 hypothetical protein JANAI61_14380 [Jannaschia sp. AI_61]GIT94812.1 hypothetical protein JANAI62_14350 [Jannaschia sp. AI_62]